MTTNGTSVVTGRNPSTRVDWVDYAKGICIVMVVMMHSVLGVELAAGESGFMHPLVAFAKPFRMPDFFLISGLFLSLVIDRDWRTYLDRKVVHFAYFYVLWVTIQFGFKAPAFAAETSWAHAGFLYVESFIEPFGTLWFIYLLPVFFVVTKATRRVPPLLIWSIAALLEMAHFITGWTVIDEFCARFVYFYTGYLFADHVFVLSDRARARPVLALLALVLWAILDGSLVKLGFSEWPLVSLVLGLVGASAIVTIGTLFAKMQWLNFLRFCGAPASSLMSEPCRWSSPWLPCSAHSRSGESHSRWGPISCSNGRSRSGLRQRRDPRCSRRNSRFPRAGGTISAAIVFQLIAPRGRVTAKLAVSDPCNPFRPCPPAKIPAQRARETVIRRKNP